jgi:hypothetical protein
VVGHADWESQNLRWDGDRPLAVHDWDSAVAQPEAVVAGLASAVWPAAGLWVRAFNAKKERLEGGSPQLDRLAEEVTERSSRAGLDA